MTMRDRSLSSRSRASQKASSFTESVIREMTVAAAQHLVEEVGVAAVPGSSFFSEPSAGRHLLRFAFCKRLETLEAAGERLARLRR